MTCADPDCNLERECKMAVIAREPNGTPKIWCDPCIAPIVGALYRAGINTIASCCGHGRRPGSIVLADGRELLIATNPEMARRMDAGFPAINDPPPR